jgi:CheY-like chemotaxis protein
MTRLRVLIVDDERIVADSLRLIFEKYGFIVQVAYSAVEGINRARQFLPELLLTDLSMPGMGGLVMASLIAHELPACRVLVLTGDYGALEEAWITGTSLFHRHAIVTKPIHPETLLHEARQLLHTAGAGFPVSLPLQ